MSVALSFWLMRNRGTRVLGFDEVRSSCCLNGVLEIGREPMVPATPQCRLIRNRLQTELITEIGVLGEGFDEGIIVVPVMTFFQQE